MTFARILLALNGLLFAAYGAACFLWPELPAGYMGVELGTTGGPVEFIAMYGGLEFAIGLYFLRASAAAARVAEGLRIMAIVFAGLGLSRLAGLLRIGVDDYNLYGVCYEIGSLVLAVAAYRLATAAWPWPGAARAAIPD